MDTVVTALSVSGVNVCSWYRRGSEEGSLGILHIGVGGAIECTAW